MCDCLFVWNRLLNHAHYGDEPFTGDSVGLGLGQRLNFIFKKLILRYFWGKIATGEKIIVLYSYYRQKRCFFKPKSLLLCFQTYLKASLISFNPITIGIYTCFRKIRAVLEIRLLPYF